MHPGISTALVVSSCLLVGITACQQPSSGDQAIHPAAKVGKEREPDWTVGWSQLKGGMDPVEVLSLLDEPKHVKITKINTTWYYSERRAEGPHVVFDTRRMRVERWRAP